MNIKCAVGANRIFWKILRAMPALPYGGTNGGNFMKKIFVLTLLAVLLAVGLVIAGCDSNGSKGSSCTKNGDCVEPTWAEYHSNPNSAILCSNSNCASVKRVYQEGWPSVPVRCDCK